MKQTCLLLAAFLVCLTAGAQTRYLDEVFSDVTVTSDIQEGVEDADAIYADVWASMGEEDLIAERIRILGPYKVTEKMMASTGKPGTIFLHCLPAFHNLDTEVSQQHPDIQEVEDAVFEGAQSRVFDQAENRLHTIKAVMVATLGN